MDTSYITPPPKETNIRVLTSSYNYEFEYNIEPIPEQKKSEQKIIVLTEHRRARTTDH